MSKKQKKSLHAYRFTREEDAHNVGQLIVRELGPGWSTHPIREQLHADQGGGVHWVCDVTSTFAPNGHGVCVFPMDADATKQPLEVIRYGGIIYRLAPNGTFDAFYWATARTPMRVVTKLSKKILKHIKRNARTASAAPAAPIEPAALIEPAAPSPWSRRKSPGDLSVWLDDLRPAPAGWVHCKTAAQVITLCSTGRVHEVSLDHDLGDEKENGTGYDVLVYLERQVAAKLLGRAPEVYIHTANPVARERMLAAIRSISRSLGRPDASR